MKKIAMYRRGKGYANEGLKERILWQLSKRPMTAKELAAALKIDVHYIVVQMRDRTLSIDKVAKITAGEWFTDDTGFRDRVYSLADKVRRQAPKTTRSQNILISKKSLSSLGEEQRQNNILAAQRRARLIAAGLYITEL